MDAQSKTTMLGGNEFVAEFNDGSKQTVKVRQLPIRKMEAYLECQQDEIKMIELVVPDLKPDQIDLLKPESHEALVAEIEKVNADFFSRWFSRLQSRVERVAPGVIANRLAALSSSPILSPKPAS